MQPVKALIPVSAAVALVCAALPAEAQDPFYKGKTVTIITSTGSGGAYDLGARTVATHMPKHLAGNPTMIVKNMPGGGHTRATNFLYTQAPKDGTTIGTVSNTIPMHQVLNGKGVRYDAAKLNWIGSTGISNPTIAVWHTAGIDSIEGAKKKELPAGATGAGSGTFIYPNVLNNMIGTKFKIVAGYRRSAEIDLAMERGEVLVRGGGSYSGYAEEKGDWIKDGKLKIIVQIGPKRIPELKNVPLMHELGETEEQRRILRLISSPALMGRPYVAPPELAKERISELRRAFDATVKDPAFVAESKKRALDLDPSTGEEIEKVVADIISSPAALVAKAKAAMEPPIGLVFPEKKKKKKE
ncbi:MAG: hypothetical protein RLZ98_3238 [Pseudomonadota bacterium]|jgi:tripartite-type tricarboxylate transporter receptor subunit TctC